MRKSSLVNYTNYINYINNASKNKILLTENIFNPLIYTKNLREEIKKAIDFIDKESKKLLNEGIEIYKKNYKDSFDKLKEYNIPIVPILESKKDILNYFEKINKQFPGVLPSDYKKLASEIIKAPAFYFYEFSLIEENIGENSKTSKEKEYRIHLLFIVIPEVSFFDRFFLYQDKHMGGPFEHRLWIELDRSISKYHEIMEFHEYAKKEFRNGVFYIENDGNYTMIGNHNSIMVLAYEAVILNKYDHLKALKRLRNYRKFAEWKIIKEKTGVDFSDLKKITKEIQNKLLSAKSVKIGKENGLVLSSSDLAHIDLAARLHKKDLKSRKIKKIIKIKKGSKYDSRFNIRK